MLDENRALLALRKRFPKAEVEYKFTHNGFHILSVISGDPYEGSMDPFWAVSSKTGKVSEFSIITDITQSELDIALARSSQRRGNSSAFR